MSPPWWGERLQGDPEISRRGPPNREISNRLGLDNFKVMASGLQQGPGSGMHGKLALPKGDVQTDIRRERPHQGFSFEPPGSATDRTRIFRLPPTASAFFSSSLPDLSSPGKR